ncbi:MAG: uracil-DNA glycosylase family protein [Prevotella sp.]|nr:uracil-DNA glycosylase family protein [Prevotella sp.]
MKIERHPLEPFLPDDARILMLGSFPPAKKRWSMDFFYPNFTNDMWRIMGLVFFGDKDHFVDQEQKTFRKECIIDFLNEQGIALYDTATAVVRTKNTASDKDLEVVEPTDLDALLRRLPRCLTVVTTGQKSTDLFTKYFNMEQPRVGASEPFVFDGRPMRLFRMPSSSRAYPMRVEQKAEYYQALFKSAENRKIAK